MPTVILRNASDQGHHVGMIFDYIGYKRLSENKRFPNHRWYNDATWGEMGEWSPLSSVNQSLSMLFGVL